MARFSYSNDQLFRLIQTIQARVLATSESKVVIPGEQAVQWIANYPPDIVERALDISSNWFVRKFKSGSPLTELDYIKYASATMRNLFDSREKYEAARKAKLRAEWNAMSPKQQAEYPRGFEDFESLAGAE